MVSSKVNMMSSANATSHVASAALDQQVKTTPSISLSVSASTMPQLNAPNTLVSMSQSHLPTSSSMATVMMSSSMSINNITTNMSLFSNGINATTSLLTSLVSSTSIPTKDEMKLFSLCGSYKTIVDDSRISTSGTLSSLRSHDCDLEYFNAVRFVTTKGESLKVKEGCTPVDQVDRSCSSHTSNVWLKGNANPNITGPQILPICIKQDIGSGFPFLTSYCDCDRTEFIFAERCQTKQGEEFFVYRLYPIFHNKEDKRDAKKCAYRYCHELEAGKILNYRKKKCLHEIFVQRNLILYIRDFQQKKS